MIELLHTILEAAILTIIAFLLYDLIITGWMKMKRIKQPVKKHKGFAVLLFVIVLLLKWNSFYFNRGGIEYRRFPLQYPYEIRDGETGTYLYRDGNAVNDACLVNFSPARDGLFFTSLPKADKVFYFGYSDRSTSVLNKASVVPDEIFSTAYFRYHTWFANLILLIAMVLLTVTNWFVGRMKRV